MQRGKLLIGRIQLIHSATLLAVQTTVAKATPQMRVQFTVTVDVFSCSFSPKFACFCACVGVEPRWNALEQAVLGALCRAGRQSHLCAAAAHNLDDDIPKEYNHALPQKPTLQVCRKVLHYK